MSREQSVSDENLFAIQLTQGPGFPDPVEWLVVMDWSGLSVYERVHTDYVPHSQITRQSAQDVLSAVLEERSNAG